jgi:polysaccharide biosynthesis protein PslG
MRRVAGLTLIVLFVAAASADAAERRVPRGWLGVTVDGPSAASEGKEWTRMARAGVETVRTTFNWSKVQPHSPDSADPSLDFRTTDALVVAAARHGIRLLPVVEMPPSWAAVQPGVAASPPSDMAAVRRIFAAFVERYGQRGSLWREQPGLPRRPIRAWQVFNEPNLGLFWTVQPFERGYVDTLKAAESGIRSIDPKATVVLGGLTNRSWRALRRIYAAGGRGAFDAVAIHPYTGSVANVLRVVRLARRVMRINGDARLPVWVTEFSWPATRGLVDPTEWNRVWGRPLSNSQQARLLGRTIRLFAAAHKRLKIEQVDWYTWLSHEAESSRNAFDFAGLRRIRGGARRDAKSLTVFRRWGRRLEGCAKSSNAERCR